MRFNELNLNNIASWNLLTKIVVIISTCFIAFEFFFVFDYRPLQKKMKLIQIDYQQLLTIYPKKYDQLIEEKNYIKQIAQMNNEINNILTLWPRQLNIPELLDDITQCGARVELNFNYIKPQTKIYYPNYTILPIKMSINGSYAQLTQFFILLEKLPYLIILDNFSIDPASSCRDKLCNELATSNLTMILTILIYQQEPIVKAEI